MHRRLNQIKYWKNAFLEFLSQPRVRNILNWLKSPAAGVVLLSLSFLMGLTKIYYGRFVDEADTMTVGWLISKGYILYQDVFSHHFPFSYYWAAGVIRIFGNSFITLRISILLLQIVLFAICMRITRYYLVIGLTSVVWNLINQFLRGQQVIYPTFDSLFMVAIFILIFWMFMERPAARKLETGFVGLLLGLAILSDPLMVYPALVAFAGLFGSGILSKFPGDIWEGFRRLLWAGSVTGLVAAIFALNLISSGTVEEFYRDTIWFNAEIYSKYVDAQPVRVGKLVQNITTGLDIFNPRWVKELSPFIPLDTYRSVGLADDQLYSSWVFSSLLYRLSILVCTAGLILKRKPAAGIFLYIISAALLIRFEDGFYANGFILVSLFAAFYSLIELQQLEVLSGERTSKTQSRLFQRVAKTGWVSVTLMVALMQLWPAFRGGFFLADHWRTVMSANHVNMYQKFGDQLHTLTCNQKNVELSVFPINPIVNFVTGIPPASKYVFMYPWVAEIGQQELIDELETNPSAVVWINTDRKADSPDGVATYMADTINFLNKEYVVIGKDLWAAPGLAQHCSNLSSKPGDQIIK